MKRFGTAVLCAFVALLGVLFSYYMTRSTMKTELTAEGIYSLALDAGYEGTLSDFINEFRGVVGKEGRGIVSAHINSDGHLIITYTDNTSVDAGCVNADSISVSDEISGKAVHTALASSVSITALRSDGAYTVGSGVIYKLDKSRGDAYIITNYHVIYDLTTNTLAPEENIAAYLYGMEYRKYAMSVELVGASRTYDIAVLKIEGSEIIKSSGAECAILKNSDSVSVLDGVIAIGNANADGISASFGSVNIESENRYIDITALGGKTFMRVIRFDASVSKGNSGGGLYNCDGELIGIVTAKNVTDTLESMAYAIPINVARAVADNIIYYCDSTDSINGKVLKIGIGLKVESASVEYDELLDATVRSEVVAIKSVEQNSYADRAGLRVGDVIVSVSVDGVEMAVTRIYHAPEATLLAREGSLIVYNVIRGEERISLTISVPSTIPQMD